jgi:catechol 2,3-dioxygenase-like lactoylglutathione lyase family enzyme
MIVRMIAFYNTIVFTNDLPRSVAFYRDVLGQEVLEDHGTIVFLANHLVLHDAASITATVTGAADARSHEPQGRGNLLVYFETDDVDAAFRTVAGSGAPIVHPVVRQEWGQSVFRFLDPDGHLVEIGEPLHLTFDET